MAGPFSFLPLSNKPGLKARVQARQDNDPTESQLPEHRLSSTTEVEMNDKDDEWYDTASSSTEGDPSPQKKDKSANLNRSVLTVKPKKLTQEEEDKLLPYMPALFGTDLPPCGLELQVAYEIVLGRLREGWLSHRGRLGVVEVSLNVQDDLRNQNYLWPPFSVKGRFKRRKPWCREQVFKYQLSWIEYFVREAQAQAPELMTESELMDRKKQSSIPPELHLAIDRLDILKMWDSWHEKKRAKTPAVPGIDMESGLEPGSPIPNENQPANENAPKSTSGSKKIGIFEPVVTNTVDDDEAKLWAQDDHD